MSLNNDVLIDSLYKIMCTSTSTAVDSNVDNNDYFKRRVLGFRAEIEFPEHVNRVESSIKFIEGGQLISKKLSGERNDNNSFIYTTISDKQPQEFLAIYNLISKWSEVTELFYIQVMDEGWSEEDLVIKKEKGGKKEKTKILTPNYILHRYNADAKSFTKASNQNFDLILDRFSKPSKAPNVFNLRKREQFEYFNNYNFKIVRNIYANRYFLDVIMRKASGRQIIDLDGFLMVKSNIFLVEIKEKSPITNDSQDENKWQYGWDSRRILWYLYVQKHLSMNVVYNVRQINNRTDRDFIKWDCIMLDTFLSGVSWSNSRGGGGGEDTLLAPYSYFSDLKDVIR